MEDESLWRDEVQQAMKEAEANGINAVPQITFRGRQRDIVLTGLKHEHVYINTLQKIVNEAT